MGADYIATGHYVRLERELPISPPALKFRRAGNSQFPNRSQAPDLESLKIAKDLNKDQSYFLWTLTQEQLEHCLFPIGNYLKPEVREIARKAGLPTAEKKDSQGICFLGKVALDEFLKGYIKPKKGKIVTISNKKIGEHEGAYYYTIGQRHGLGVGGGKPYYVAEKDVKTNTIVVAEGGDDPALFRKEVRLTNLNFIDPTYHSTIRVNGGMSVTARVRYRQPLAEANLVTSNEGQETRLVFDKPQKFVAAGQSAVFYAKDGEMLGGGVIL